MTKGGKKRKGPSRSESQDGSGKYIPQFNKKRKPNNGLDENLEQTQSNGESIQPVEEKTFKLTSSDEDDTKTEVNKMASDISEEDANVENGNSGTVSASNTSVSSTRPTDHDTTVKQPSGFDKRLEECGSEGKKLPDTTSPTTAVEASLKDIKYKTSQAATVGGSPAVLVVEMDSEQSEVVTGMANTKEKPRFIDAATQVEISDDNTAVVKQTAGSKVSSDPLIPALLDELSALNRLVMSCKRELETVRRKQNIWMKNNKNIK